jgi:hypothetical protein
VKRSAESDYRIVRRVVLQNFEEEVPDIIVVEIQHRRNDYCGSLGGRNAESERRIRTPPWRERKPATSVGGRTATAPDPPLSDE